MPQHAVCHCWPASRAGQGNPFYRLNDLRPGDKVMIETAAATYTYQVTTTELVILL